MKALAVRAVVFIEEQCCPYHEEVDGLDYTALHVLGEVGSEPVSTGRIRFYSGYAKLERLAVWKAYRGKGYGDQLLTFMMKCGEERCFSQFKLHAQVQALPFYEKHGFLAEGDEFLEANIVPWGPRGENRKNGVGELLVELLVPGTRLISLTIRLVF